MIGIFGTLFAMISVLAAYFGSPAWSEMDAEAVEDISIVEVPSECGPPSIEP